MFEELMITQMSLQNAMGWPGGRGIEGFRTSILAANVEMVEALSELPWKPWKNYPHTVEEVMLDDEMRKIIATEITDVFQFLANAALSIGLTHFELSAALRDKWVVNRTRINKGETTRA